MADIFISYRRGEGDSPNAGRIRDYLVGLGYSVFYDQDETQMPTGEPFPETLTKAVESSRVILAVIGKSWIEEMSRLREEDDWVRAELRRAEPAAGRYFIPIYLGVHPGQLADGLPDDLSFLSDTNSHCLWSHFEASEKKKLLELLRERLRPHKGKERAGVEPRLELLCDRSHAETRFWCALSNGQRGWLVLGGKDQGQIDLLNRLTAISLPALEEIYPSPMIIQLRDLSKFYGCPLEEIRAHLFLTCTKELSAIVITTWDSLLTELARQNYSLALFYGVVEVDDVEKVQWWEKRFSELLNELPRIEGKAHLFFVLALTYQAKRGGLLSFLKKDVSSYLAERYPDEQSGAEVSVTTVNTTTFATTWLHSAKRIDVEEWWSYEQVQPYYNWKRKQASLQPFEKAEQIPMGHMLFHLETVLKDPAYIQETPQ